MPSAVAEDFRDQTIISYPVPEEMLDLFRQVLLTAGIRPAGRTTELTVAMLQLVASHRGVAALPLWGVTTYVEKHYVTARRITREAFVRGSGQPRCPRSAPSPM